MADDAQRTDLTSPTVPMANAAAPSRNKGCKCLRWKGMYIEAETDPLLPNSDAGIYWCVHTMTCLGPDGEVASAKTCGAGRGCFEVR
jgi:hypothetical protein